MFGWDGEICKERSDGIAFCSTKNFIFLAKRVTPGQLKRNFLTFWEENSRPLRGHKEKQPHKHMRLLSLSIWLGWRDLNSRMTESESVALPLGDTPIFLAITTTDYSAAPDKFTLPRYFTRFFVVWQAFLYRFLFFLFNFDNSHTAGNFSD